MSEVQNRVSWFSLTTIQMGGALSLPVIAAGHAITQHYGWKTALVSLGIGNVLLWIFALLASHVAVIYRMNTAALIKALCGEAGGKIGVLALVISMTGWFAVQLNIASASIAAMLPTLPSYLFAFALGSLIVGFCLRGISGLRDLAAVSVPMLVVLAAAVFYKVAAYGSCVTNATVVQGSAIATVVALALGAVTDLPTYYRFARSRLQAWISVSLVFLVIIPLIEGIGVVLGACLRGNTIVEVLGSNASLVVQLGINALIIGTALIASSSNLYTAAVSLPVIVPKLSQSYATVFAGVAGIGLACLPLIACYEQVLSWLALATSGLGVLMLGSYILLVKANMVVRPLSCALAWMAGIMCGVGSMLGIVTITGEPLCDTALVTGVTLLLLSVISKAKEIKTITEGTIQ